MAVLFAFSSRGWRGLLGWLRAGLMGFLGFGGLLGGAWAQAPSTPLAPLTVGVMTYRPEAAMRPVFEPLMHYLSEQLDGRPVQLRLLDAEALARQVDLVVANPGYALALRHQIGTATLLATLVRTARGQAVRSLGGTLVTAAGRAELQHWRDLRGLSIGYGGAHLFGSYHVHAYEMQQLGLPYPGSNRLVHYLWQEDALLAAARGEVDVAQVRSGLLEQLVQEGRLKADEVRVIAPQQFEGFPYQASTRLYPEWPVMALPHLDGEVQRRVAAALLALTPDHPSARAARIAGFAPAADYTPVERLAQALGVPPFDAQPAVDWRQVWYSYRWVIVVATLAALALVWITVLLWRRQRQLGGLLLERGGLLARIEADAQRLSDLLAGSPSLIYALDPRTLAALYVGPNIRQLCGVEPGERDWWRAVIHPQDGPVSEAAFLRWVEGGCLAPLVQTYRMRHRDGHWLSIEDRVRARRDPKGRVQELIGSHTDVSDRAAAEQSLRLNASVFEHAREGIIITDVKGSILDVNPSFCRITGYAREQVFGHNPSLLKSGRQDAAFYREMWRSITEDGHWEGEIWNRRASGELYSQHTTLSVVRDPAGQPTHYVSVFTDITEKKAYESRLFQLAYYDELTGLPTRGLLTDRLRQALGRLRRSPKGALSVAFLDLDGFKEVNDRHGHALGDRLLQEVARRLQACLREGDTVARLGGDEFVVLLLDHEAQPSRDPLMQRLLHAAADPVAVEGGELGVSASIGVCVCYPGSDADADQILRQADHAMYAAKLAGKSRYHVFDSRVDERVRTTQHWRDRIAQGLQEGEFVLYYQPKVELRSGRLHGVEALIRWQHPEQGLLAPAAFLPATHGHPLELSVGRWVMGEALRQAEVWRAQGLDVPVSVNIAADHLLDPGFVDELVRLLARHPDLPHGTLELEVLESTALADLRGASGILRRCQALGVRSALDDFGTGYSSLTYLKTLPTDTLKIDQSFVRDMINDPDDLAILQGVLDLARVFRRQVVAEGVETETHGLMLLHLGCELGQGYGIARPMPAHELLGWVQRWQPPVRWQQVPPHHVDRVELLMAAVDLRQGLQRLRQHLEHGGGDALEIDIHAERLEQCLLATPLDGTGGMQALRPVYEDMVEAARQALALRQAGQSDAALEQLQTSERLYEALLEGLLRHAAEL